MLPRLDMDVIYFILLIGPLVFVHELGHFLVAKAFRIKVLKFSLGFGPLMIGKQWGETYYQIAWIPLGGFVRFLGDDPREDVLPRDRARTFLSAAAWKRALVVFAGPCMSLLFPVLCYFAVGMMIDELAPPTIGEVVPETPAERAGMRAGDRVVSVDGEPIYGFSDLQDAISSRPGEDLSIVVQRGDERLTLSVRPTLVKRARFPMFDIFEEVGQLGIHGVYPAPVIGVPSDSSPAAQAGLRTFDLVTGVDGRPTRRWIDLEQVLADAIPGRPMEVSYLRTQQTGWAFADVFVHEPGRATVTPAAGEGGRADVGVELASLYVSHVLAGWPGDVAGLRPGDKIVAVDGHAIRVWVQFVDAINRVPDQPHRISVVRGGEELTAELRLERRTRNDRYGGEVVDYRPGIGVFRAYTVDDPVPNPNRIARAAVGAVRETVEVIHFMAIGIMRMLQGRVSCESIGGPIMLFEIAGTAGRQGAHSFLSVLALISVNLGLLNLLPVPVLDGGHLMLLGVETVRRRPLSLKAREIVNLVGLGLLILLMVFAFKNDIQRYWDWEDVTSLFGE
jgi:regulator of sigma E protease